MTTRDRSREGPTGQALKTASERSRLSCRSQYRGAISSAEAVGKPSGPPSPIQTLMATWAAYTPLLGQLLVQVDDPVAQRRPGRVDVAEHRHRVDGSAAGGEQQGPGTGLPHRGQDRPSRRDGAVEEVLELRLQIVHRDLGGGGEDMTGHRGVRGR